MYGDAEKIIGNEKGIDASIFEDNVIIFTTRMYGLLRTPVGFKNLAFRDGKMVIVADLDDNEMDGCTQMDYYLDFIIVPKSEIPEGTAKDGRIEILDRYLRSATNKDGDSKNDNNNPSQSSGIKREPLSEEQ